MQRLDCHVKNYAWGKDGEASEVARLFAAGHPDHKIGHQTPYAELWMGTHPDGPAKVHPTKEQAVRLHAKDPLNYPDRHHKPELAYALTRFELLCGFRPASEIINNMKAFPELRKIMGEEASGIFENLFKQGMSQESPEMKKALRRCFSNMLYRQRESQFVNEQLKNFYKKIENGVRGSLIEDTIPVLESMRKHFPGDVGCFSPLYLNHMILQPGECCFYAAEELHAYLSGECVECVGCSNNTIRAALTPKFVDKDALIEVLNYRMTNPEFYLVPPKQLKNYPCVTEYAPDCKDFTLHQIEISNQTSPTCLPALHCASIIVVVEGAADCEGPHRQRVQRGDIFYIPPDRSVRFTDVHSERLLAYRTFSFEIGPDHSNRKQIIPLVEDNILPIRTNSVLVPELDKLKEKILVDRPKFGLENDCELFDLDADMDGLC